MSPANAARQLFQNFKERRTRKTLYNRIREFQSRLHVHFETEEHVVKTAETPAEMLKVLQLRHEVFIQEWQGRSLPLGLDIDEFDFSGDHLLIIERKNWEIIGTYRLLCSRFTEDFYSSHEFHLEEFLAQPGVKLELGRACIRQDKRDGNSIDLLWKGLAKYIETAGARYLFGCASVISTDVQMISSLYSKMKKDEQWTNEYQVQATEDYVLPDFDMENMPPLGPQDLRKHVPALLRSYLHAGAKVYGEPALDQEFACADLLTILDMEKLNPRFRSRFFGR